ncbi:MlaA family lipoprotein, partial [Methylophilus sp.]
NRKTFAFNEKLDKAVLIPVAKSYQSVVPVEVRKSVSNFYANPRDLVSALSLVLQGRPQEGASDLIRFGTNTTVGVLGLFDVATHLGFEKHNEDLGQVLGHWGMDAGAYIVWPLFGPSSTRDTAALIGNLAVTPQVFVSDTGLYNFLTGMQVVNSRSELLSTSELIDESALDPYLFVRDAYLQYRQHLVYNGNPPPLSEEDLFDDPPIENEYLKHHTPSGLDKSPSD